MRSPVVLLCSVALAACPIGDRPAQPDAGADEPVEACGTFEIPATQIDAAAPWPHIKCADFPALCNLPVDSTVNEPDTKKAFDIVFVSEGYTKDELPAYHDEVARLQKALADATVQGVVSRRPKLFNFYRVDLVSQTQHVSNADRGDTALAGCVDIAVDGSLVMDERLAGLAATANVKDVDAIVGVFHTNAGTPNATDGPAPDHPSFVRINPLVDGMVLNHEFGHALFHLGDEYATEPACFTPPDLPQFTTADFLYDTPNLSTDKTGAKWAASVQGAEAGGMDFIYCLWHPTPKCLMNDAQSPFCAVCSAALDATLDAREGKNDGPPRCGIELGSFLPTFVHGSLDARVVVFDRNHPTHYSLKLDGAEIAKGDAAFWYQRASAPAVDTTKLGNGTHSLQLDCQDALGATSTVKLDVKVQN